MPVQLAQDIGAWINNDDGLSQNSSRSLQRQPRLFTGIGQFLLMSSSLRLAQRHETALADLSGAPPAASKAAFECLTGCAPIGPAWIKEHEFEEGGDAVAAAEDLPTRWFHCRRQQHRANISRTFAPCKASFYKSGHWINNDDSMTSYRDRPVPP